MRKILFLIPIFFLTSCKNSDKKKSAIPSFAPSEDEWAVYEGRWLSQEGVIEFELQLKTGTGDIDTYYKLHESMHSTKMASSTSSQGMYSSYYDLPNSETGICLHDLATYPELFKGPIHLGFKRPLHLRYKKSAIDDSEEMFFITRGVDELIPTDNNFKPITTDSRYTLHKRSKLFTVEGYLTFERDSATFFERNTHEHWRIADLGEFNEAMSIYKKLAKEPREGVYLKALAYAVSDSTSQNEKDALVIKRIIDSGNDPD